MTTITIPKTVRDKDLIAVPRDVYEEFLSWEKKVKSSRTFRPTASEKESLVRARKNLVKGNYGGGSYITL